MSRLDLGIFFLLIVGFLAAGYMRNLVWKDEVEVWRDAGGKSPQKVRPHNNLGNALRDDAGLLHEAVKEYRTAIRIAPGEVPPRHNISVAYLMLGMYDEAEKELLVAIRLMPDHPTLHGNLGFLYLKKGLWKEAAREFKVALKLDPDYRMARDNLEWLRWWTGAE
jgi:tetratricopeptide (TPR) repeat protein